MTEKFYYHSPYATQMVAHLLDVRQKEQSLWLLPDKTLFYPGGGGQLPDRGSINDLPLLEIKEKNGKIWHRVALHGADFSVGQKVVLTLDWAYRYYQMQQHTGQHLLSAVLHKAGWPTVSVHLGEDHTLIETEGPLPEISALKKVENEAQQLIAQALPVEIHWLTEAQIAQFPLRRPPKAFDNLRVVEIKSFDYSACGGTHVKNTAEIGLIKIIGSEKIRGRARIKALIGQKAFDYLEELHQTNLQLREKLNTHHLQFNERVAQLQEEIQYLKRLKKFYQQYFTDYQSRALAEATPETLIVFKLEQGEQQDAADLAKKLSKQHGKVALVQFDRRFYLASPSPTTFDTIKFLKEHAESLEIKGGGPQGFCQGVMNRNNLQQIAETIKLLITEN